jgi:acyl-CoA dehydrogenase family protein 9
MGIELFATAAMIARTQQLIVTRGAEQCEREMALCDLACVEAGRRFRAARVRLESPEDATRRDVSGWVREAKGYFVEDSILEETGVE